MHKRRSICSSSNTIGERTLRGYTFDGADAAHHRDFHPPPPPPLLPRQSEHDALGTRVHFAPLPSEAAPLSIWEAASSVAREVSAGESIAVIVGV